LNYGPGFQPRLRGCERRRERRYGKQMKNNIALIGFMAAGKSAVGKLLAQNNGKTFVEIDSLIEQKVGKPIWRIFREEGEITFREYEIEIVKEIFSRENQVIACGGGVVLNKINVDRLKQRSIMVWLTASVQEILERLKNTGEIRPLINEVDREKQVRSLLDFRRPFYKSAADIHIDTSGLTIEQVVIKIQKKLKKYADYS
jgi:shikimate kinase